MQLQPIETVPRFVLRILFARLVERSSNESLCICLSSTQLLAVSKLSHLTFAGANVILGMHLYIVLREAARSKFAKERAVTSFEDVDLGICQFRITEVVDGAVLATDELGPEDIVSKRL